MPFRSRKSPPEPPANPEDWRPQRAGRVFRAVRDAVIEPGWGGVRVLAHFDGTGTRLIDEDGVDCTVEFAEVAQAIAAAALAVGFILDGYLTAEATQFAVGVLPAEVRAQSGGKMMAQWIVGDRIARSAEPERHLDPDRPVAFVAVDLLQIDGTGLLDVPLLERKRLLEGSLAPAELVRVTPFIRPPIGSFLTTWRGMGFTALAYKGANSRYAPGARNDDWSIKPMPPQ